MRLLQLVAQVIGTERFSYFDVWCIGSITYMAMEHQWRWLLIPAILLTAVVSVTVREFGKDRA
jgi:hypothetical protein